MCTAVLALTHCFKTLFVTIFFAAVCGDILHADAMQYYCSNRSGLGGHIRYATEYYFVTLEFAGAAVAVFFVVRLTGPCMCLLHIYWTLIIIPYFLQGLAVFFQFLLALCRFKSDTGYDTHCAGALCSGGCAAGQEESK